MTMKDFLIHKQGRITVLLEVNESDEENKHANKYYWQYKAEKKPVNRYAKNERYWRNKLEASAVMQGSKSLNIKENG